MPDFYRDFLHTEILALPRTSPPVVHLAAFGKHPAWNDHMEDIGVNTVALLEAKRYLYLQGISGQIDTAAWDKTTATFNHSLLWHRPGELLLGRLLASTDGKGRARYPLVIIAHIINLPLAPALETCAPLIDEAARAARAATTPDAVRTIITQTRTRLAAAANTAPDNYSPLLPFTRPELDTTNWTRLYHVIENQLHQYGPGSKTDTPSPRHLRHLRLPAAPRHLRHLRLPAASATPAQNLLWWTTFWLTQLDPKYPTLLIAPANAATHTDLIIGEPASQHFRCLLSDETAIPSITETPYAPGDHIARVTAELLSASDTNAIPARSLFNAKTPTRDTALATICTRSGLATILRPPGLLKKLFG